MAGGFVQDKVVLVTGAGGGIGRDFALALAREGAKVVVNDIGASVQGEGRDLSRAAATHFKMQQSGSYIHMVSTSGLIGNFGQANYSAAKLGLVALSKSIAMDMAKFKVRSNCISPFAWSRMIGAIPTETEEQKARVKRLKRMETAKIAPLAVYLASDAAADVSGQIFAVRANEIFLMSQSRPQRAMHTAEGWTPHSIAERVIPAMRPSFYRLDRSQDVFDWDPV
jgi:NAD(P)-dependent dehydrogenase (short-subunit alcohol dehydrogenase family)